MSGRGSKWGHHNRYKSDKHKASVGEKGKETLKEIDESNPVIKAFQSYAKELDDKHDRYERLVKISRDITIESKRIIFLLHNVDKENKRESILKEAETRLKNLITTNFKNVAIELENQDPFLYNRAYTAGMQEFIEAYTFYQYLKNNSIEHWSNLENQLVYEITSKKEEEEEPTTKELKAFLPAVDFILGVADLTGELMRKCINNLGSGNIDDCFQICNFVKELHRGFLNVGGSQNYREIGRKVYVLKQSLHKMEIVCYNIVVRGSEVPKHMLAAVVTTNNSEVTHDDDDEGFY